MLSMEGLGMTVQTEPSQCSVRVLLAAFPITLIPTAQTSFAERADTPLREAIESGGWGAGTIDQLEPFQCSMRGFPTREPRDDPPTAQMSLADMTLTSLRTLPGKAEFGLGTTFHSQVCAEVRLTASKENITIENGTNTTKAVRHRRIIGLVFISVMIVDYDSG